MSTVVYNYKQDLQEPSNFFENMETSRLYELELWVLGTLYYCYTIYDGDSWC